MYSFDPVNIVFLCQSLYRQSILYGNNTPFIETQNPASTDKRIIRINSVAHTVKFDRLISHINFQKALPYS